MTGVYIVVVVTTLLVIPTPVTAQAISVGSVHVHRSATVDRLISLENVRLFVPAGVAQSGAIIGLGVGGVPRAGRITDATGLVISAAGALETPVVALILPSIADAPATDGTVPGLTNTATGADLSCRHEAGWVACPISQVGAYTLGRIAAPPADSELVRAALRAVQSPPDTAGRRRAPLTVVVAVALIIGVAVALVVARGDSGGRPAR